MLHDVQVIPKLWKVRMIRPFTAVHLCYIMLSLSVNLMGWAPQKIKCTHKKICWGLTPFYFRFA